MGISNGNANSSRGIRLSFPFMMDWHGREAFAHNTNSPGARYLYLAPGLYVLTSQPHLYGKAAFEKAGVPVYYNIPALQYNFVFIIFHDTICSLFLICALADNFSATFLGNTIGSGIFLIHINSYFLSSLSTSIFYHSLSDFSCIALTPKILMYAISNIVYFLVITYHETACPYPL